jgi:hypothetical protein
MCKGDNATLFLSLFPYCWGLAVSFVSDALAKAPACNLRFTSRFDRLHIKLAPTDIGSSAIEKAKQQMQGWVKWLCMTVIDLATVALGNAFHSFIPGLLMLGMVDFALIPNTFAGPIFTLRETFIPSCSNAQLGQW